MTKTQRFDYIQILRGFAVLLVVGFHTHEASFPLGYLGVDIFFVISGFVIAPSLMTIVNSETLGDSIKLLRHFYVRRIRRLLPAFSFFMILTLVLLSLLASINDFRKIAGQGIFSLVALGNIGAFFFSGNYFNPNPNPYIHLWSLATEEQLYFFLPLLFLLIPGNVWRASLKQKSFYTKFLIVSLLFYFLLLFFSQDFTLFRAVSDYYSPFSKVWLFALGGFLRYSALVVNTPKGIKRNTFIAILFGALTCLAGIIASPARISQLSGLLVAGLFSSLFIFLGKNGYFSQSFFLILKFIGDRSYSIYLFHMPLIYLAKYSPLSGATTVVRICALLLAIILTFILANYSYKHFENRFRVMEEPPTQPVGRFLAKSNFLIILTLVPMFLASNLPSVFGVPSSRATIAKPLIKNCVANTPEAACFSRSGLSRPYVLLLGDSHARHYSGILEKFVSSRGWNLVYLPVNVISAGGLGNLGIEENSKLRSLLELRRPEFVILSELVYSKSINSELYQTVMQLEIQAGKIVIIGQSPRFTDKNEFMHFMYPSLISSEFVSTPRLSIPTSELERESTISGDWLREISREYQFRFVDPLPIFCPNSLCIRKNSSGWLYVDDHHLSRQGAELLETELTKSLNRWFRN